MDEHKTHQIKQCRIPKQVAEKLTWYHVNTWPIHEVPKNTNVSTQRSGVVMMRPELNIPLLGGKTEDSSILCAR